MSVAKLPAINSGNPLLDLTNVHDYGWGSPQDNNPVHFDLFDADAGLLKQIVISVMTTNGQDTTPASPGANRKWQLWFAFSNNLITDANAPARLQTRAKTLDCLLPDSAAADVREHSTDAILVTGRYLYVWWRFTGFDNSDAAINAQVTALTLS